MAIPLYLVNAFTNTVHGGNPAAVLLVDEFPEAAQKIAATLNQPIATFLRPTSVIEPGATSAAYDVRWWASETEVPICGHGTLAASGLLFSEPTLLPSSVTTISFRAASGAVLTAQKDGDWVEIKLASTIVQPPSHEVEGKIRAVLKKALGEDAPVTYLGLGGKGYETYMMVEVDESYNLGDHEVNIDALRELAPQTTVTVVTSTSPKSDVTFVSRMFAPVAGVPEDHVCGSAHCLLVPHWTKKLNRSGEQMLAEQVSRRGGDLKVKWMEADGRISLCGQTRTNVKGHLLL